MAQPTTIHGLAGEDLPQGGAVFVYADGNDNERIKKQITDDDTTTVGVLLPDRSTNGNKDETLVQFTATGFARVTAGATIEPYDIVGCDASGYAIPAVATKVKLGQFIPKKRNADGTFADAASGDLIDILLFENKSEVVPA